MTEDEWLTDTDPHYHLTFLRKQKGEGYVKTGMEMHRKLRLWAAACCRRIQSFFQDDSLLAGVVIAELYADGLASDEEMKGVVQNAESYASQGRTVSQYAARTFASTAAVWDSSFAPMGVRHWVDQIGINERKDCCSFLRDIVGNPFRPVTLNPSWLTSTVTRLAQAIYEDRNMPAGLFDNLRMRILADALEEGGCDNQAILDHLRNGKDHVRGCWVVDLVLQKE